MLTHDELIKEISKTLAKTKVIKLTAILREQQFELRDLVDITFNDDNGIAFRAAWLLENFYLKNPEGYIDQISDLLSRLPEIKNPSCKRHYTKIIEHITDPKAPPAIRQKLLEIDLEPVVETLFDWLIDPKVKIAVKVFAATALFNLRERYTWIKDELADQLRFMLRDGSAGIQSRGKKLLDKLSA